MIKYTLDQIVSFSLAAQHGSFAKAARVSGKDRTTISEHVSNLEILLNFELFYRNYNKLAITDRGKILLRWSDLLIHSAEKFQSLSDSLSISENNHFRVSIDMQLPNEMIIEVFNEMKLFSNHITIDWLCLNRSDALAGLIDKSIDAAIILMDERSLKLNHHSGLVGCYLGNMNGKIYTAACSPLQKLGPVDFDDLANNTEYVLESILDSGLTEAISFSGKKVTLGSMELLINFLEQDGWAYLPSTPNVVNNPKIKPLEAKFLNTGWSIGHMLMSRSDIGSEFYQCLINIIKKSYNKLN